MCDQLCDHRVQNIFTSTSLINGYTYIILHCSIIHAHTRKRDSLILSICHAPLVFKKQIDSTWLALLLITFGALSPQNLYFQATCDQCWVSKFPEKKITFFGGQRSMNNGIIFPTAYADSMLSWSLSISPNKFN